MLDETLLQETIAIRRLIHQKPELGFALEKTAALVEKV